MVATKIFLINFMFYLQYEESKAEILRLQCGTYANFSVIKENSRLHNTFHTLWGTDSETCQNECGMEPRCKSINVHEDEYICELNDKSADDPKDNTGAVQEMGWTYLSPSYKEKLVGINCRRRNPCNWTQKCIDMCECPGYRCIDKFKVIKDQLNWDNSRAWCKRHGGDLASIVDDEEYRIVEELISAFPDSRFHIGLTDVANEGTFVWSDGSQLSFLKCNGGEPNNHGGAEDCVEQQQSGWNDGTCASILPFICKFPI